MNEDRWGVLGLVLLVVGAALAWWGFAGDLPGVLVPAIVVLVAALACLRARSWIRKARVLGEVGRDLHVPDDSEE